VGAGGRETRMKAPGAPDDGDAIYLDGDWNRPLTDEERAYLAKSSYAQAVLRLKPIAYWPWGVTIARVPEKGGQG